MLIYVLKLLIIAVIFSGNDRTSVMETLRKKDKY